MLNFARSLSILLMVMPCMSYAHNDTFDEVAAMQLKLQASDARMGLETIKNYQLATTMSTTFPEEKCNWECYVNWYPDLQAAFGTNYKAAERHYWRRGHLEGRICYCATKPYMCQAWGDPHFTESFRGSHFDFMGVGNFRLARSLDKQFEVQAFQVPLDYPASIFAGFAAKIYGNVVTIIGKDITINGKSITHAWSDEDVEGATGKLRVSEDLTQVRWDYLDSKNQPITFNSQWVDFARKDRYYMNIFLLMTYRSNDGVGLCENGTDTEPLSCEDSFFTSSQMQELCGVAGIKDCCNPEQPVDPIDGPEDACEKSGISYDLAAEKCASLKDLEAHFNACILDYCSTDGDDSFVENAKKNTPPPTPAPPTPAPPPPAPTPAPTPAPMMSTKPEPPPEVETTTPTEPSFTTANKELTTTTAPPPTTVTTTFPEEKCDWQCYLNRYKGLRKAYGPNNVVEAEKHWYRRGKAEGKVCHCPLAPKICHVWGDPHFTHSFFDEHFSFQGVGLFKLAETRKLDIEVQGFMIPLQYPASVIGGVALRFGATVVSILGREIYVNGSKIPAGEYGTKFDGLWASASHEQVRYDLPDKAVKFSSQWVHFRTAPNFYLNLFLQMDVRKVGYDGICATSVREPLACPNSLFSSAEFAILCSKSGLEDCCNPEQPSKVIASPEEACTDAGIDYEMAQGKCDGLVESPPHFKSCVMDYCGTGGDDQVAKSAYRQYKADQKYEQNHPNVKATKDLANGNKEGA